MLRNVWLISCLLVASCVQSLPVKPPERGLWQSSARQSLNDPYDPMLVRRLHHVLVQHMQLESGEFVRHCRVATGGCVQRMLHFANAFVMAGGQAGVDPWLLAAIAMHETGLNPWAVSSVGALGIMQLHPRWHQDVEFVRNPLYRRRCRRDPSACQDEVVQRGTDVYVANLRHCGTSAAALRRYNTGSCTGNPKYARRVLRWYRILKRHDPTWPYAGITAQRYPGCLTVTNVGVVPRPWCSAVQYHRRRYRCVRA